MENNVQKVIDPEFVELIEKRQHRPEIGAMWKKTSSKNGNPYHTLRVKLTKQELLGLIDQIEQGDEVALLDLVAFPTRNTDNPRRPSYRLYKELR